MLGEERVPVRGAHEMLALCVGERASRFGGGAEREHAGWDHRSFGDQRACADHSGLRAQRRVLDLEMPRRKRQRTVIDALPHRGQEQGADLRDARLTSMSLAVSESEMWYLPFGHRRPADIMNPEPVDGNLPPLADSRLAPLRELLQDPLVPKGGHDLKYDWQVLRKEGVELAGVMYDSMLASFVLDPSRRSRWGPSWTTC